MPDFITFDALFLIGRNEVLTRSKDLSREAVERDGSDANIMIAAGAAMGDEVTGQVNDLASSLFLDSAEKDALDRLVFDRYGLVRKPAAASVGSVQFSTPTASATTFTIPVNTVVQTGAAVQYVTTESTIFSVGTVGPYTVAVRSVLAGSGLNARANTINSIVSTISSAPANLAVTNTFATFGSDDAERDESLRDRARRFFSTARRGTNAAIEAAALGINGVRKATAFEGIDAYGRPARTVQLVITDAFTEQFVSYDTVPPRYQTQSQTIATSVLEALEDVRPGGTYVRVIVANVILQPVQLALAFQAGANVSNTAQQARAAVVDYINNLAPGKTLVLSAILSRLQLVPGLQYTGREIISPVGDVVPKPLQVLRTMLGIVTAVAAQNNQPIVTGDNPDAYVIGG